MSQNHRNQRLVNLDEAKFRRVREKLNVLRCFAEAARHRLSVINSLIAEVSAIGLLPHTAIVGSIIQNRPYAPIEGGSSSGQVVLAALLIPGGIGVTVFDSEEYCDLKDVAEGLEANAALHFRPFDQCELAVQGLLACQVDELIDRFVCLFDQ